MAGEAWHIDSWEVLKATAYIVGGVLAKAVFDAWQKRQEKPVIECEILHFDFVEAISQIKQFELPLLVDGQPVDAAFIIHRLRVRGGQSVKKVQVEVRAGKGNKIFLHRHFVEQRIICDRLTTTHEDADRIRCEWSYLNPGDLVELELVVAPCVDPVAVVVDVDAEGVRVLHEQMKLRCAAKYSERLNLIQTRDKSGRKES